MVKLIDAGASKEAELEKFFSIVQGELVSYLDKEEVADVYVSVVGQVLEVSQAIAAIQGKEVLKHMHYVSAVEKLKKAFNFVDHLKPVALLANALGACSFWKDKLCAWLEKVSSLRRHSLEIQRVTEMLNTEQVAKADNKQLKDMLSIVRDMMVLQEDCIDESVTGMGDLVCKRLDHLWRATKTQVDGGDAMDLKLCQEVLAEASATFLAYSEFNIYRGELNQMMVVEAGTTKLNDMMQAFQTGVDAWKEAEILNDDVYTKWLDKASLALGIPLCDWSKETFQKHVLTLKGLLPAIMEKGLKEIEKLHAIVMKMHTWDMHGWLKEVGDLLTVWLGLTDALSYYQDKEVTKAVEEDVASEHLASLMRAAQEAEAVQDKEWHGAETLKKELSVAKETLKKAEVVMLKDSVEGLNQKKTELLANLGGEHGALAWLDGIDQSSWAQVKDAAETAFTNVKGKELSASLDVLLEAC